MPKTPLFRALARSMRIGLFCNDKGLSTREGLERAEAAAASRRPPSRREFVKGAAAVSAFAALAPSLLRTRRAEAKQLGEVSVAIIGGGLAGLTCADRLQRWGVIPTIFEANSRLGGRVNTAYGTFPGQVGELGGEMIDNAHKTMLGYANALNLAREDLGKSPGKTFFYFNGSNHDEAEYIDQFRLFAARTKADLQSLSGAPSRASHTDADVALDNTSLGEYLATRGAGLPLLQGVLRQAYIAEYGLEPEQQSCLGLLFFIHMDRRSKFRPYGGSDERFHLVGGNSKLIDGLAARFTGTIETSARMSRLARNAGGKYEVTINGVVRAFDAVVLTLPFSVLRTPGLLDDVSLGITLEKRNAINNLGYGANAKTMIGFQGRPWAPHGSDGDAYSDLPNLQNTWETNYSLAGATSILTDYSGGTRGANLQRVAGACGMCHVSDGSGPNTANATIQTTLQAQVGAFLTDLDKVYPGAKAAATVGADGNYVVRRGHWLTQRYSRGSYTCYKPGQFTTICGDEGTSIQGLKFAGEHADSFYNWQGFMEGAANSGIAAADEIIADIAAGRL